MGQKQAGKNRRVSKRELLLIDCNHGRRVVSNFSEGLKLDPFITNLDEQE